MLHNKKINEIDTIAGLKDCYCPVAACNAKLDVVTTDTLQDTIFTCAKCAESRSLLQHAYIENSTTCIADIAQAAFTQAAEISEDDLYDELTQIRRTAKYAAYLEDIAYTTPTGLVEYRYSDFDDTFLSDKIKPVKHKSQETTYLIYKYTTHKGYITKLKALAPDKTEYITVLEDTAGFYTPDQGRPSLCTSCLIAPDADTATALLIKLKQAGGRYPIPIVLDNFPPLLAATTLLYPYTVTGGRIRASYVVELLNNGYELNVLDHKLADLNQYNVQDLCKTSLSNCYDWLRQAVTSGISEDRISTLRPTANVRQSLLDNLTQNKCDVRYITNLRKQTRGTNSSEFAGVKLRVQDVGYAATIDGRSLAITNFTCTIQEYLIHPEHGVQDVCLHIQARDNTGKKCTFPIQVPATYMEDAGLYRLLRTIRAEALLHKHIVNPYTRTLPLEGTWASVFHLFSEPIVTTSLSELGVCDSLIRTADGCYDFNTHVLARRPLIKGHFNSFSHIDTGAVDTEAFQAVYASRPLLLELLLHAAKDLANTLTAVHKDPTHILLPATSSSSNHAQTLAYFNYILHGRQQVAAYAHKTLKTALADVEQEQGLPAACDMYWTTGVLKALPDNSGPVYAIRAATDIHSTYGQSNVMYAVTPNDNDTSEIPTSILDRVAKCWLTVVQEAAKYSVSELAGIVGVSDYVTVLDALYDIEKVDIVPFCLQYISKGGYIITKSKNIHKRNCMAIARWDEADNTLTLSLGRMREALKGNSLGITLEHLEKTLRARYHVEGFTKLTIRKAVWDKFTTGLYLKPEAKLQFKVG